ncbi:MAG TPA: tetratricopeptide repeat protein [Nevskiaceae bacterium]
MSTTIVHADAAAQRSLAEAHRLSESGDLAGARTLYQALVDQPGFTATCLYRLGLIAGTSGDHRRAATLVQAAIRLQPQLWEAYPVWSAALRRAGDRDASLAALIGYGNALDQAGERALAVDIFRAVLKQDPLNFPARANAGHCLAWLGRPRDAAPYLAQALRLAGRIHPAVDSLIRQLAARTGDRLALAAEPLPNGEPHGVEHLERVLTTLGKVLSDAYFVREAISCHRMATWLAPRYALAHWNLALALLAQGDWKNGWREYEWRWQWPECPEPVKRVPVSPWRGQPLKGRTVLVWAEQGLGDAIQFLPLVHELQKRGARIVLETPHTLRRLFAESLPDVELVDRPGRPDLLSTAERLDYIVPLMSLPERLALASDQLPLAVDYLHAPAAAAETWRQRLARLPHPRVGIVWDGRTNHLPFDALRPLFELQDIAWCSLQIGAQSRRIADNAMENMTDCSLWLDDLAETAAAIEQLDLVVTIDTSIAHLAGALGKAVWVMLDSAPNWRWRGADGRSPWYPSMRLFRRGRDQPWERSIDALESALRKWHDTRPQEASVTPVARVADRSERL